MGLQVTTEQATSYGVAQGRARHNPEQAIQSAGRIYYSMQQVSVATQIHSRSLHLLYIICTLYACYDRVTNKIRRWHQSVPYLALCRQSSFTLKAHTLLWYRDFREVDPLPSGSTFGADKSESALFGQTRGISCCWYVFVLSHTPSLTTNVAVQPLPVPSLSIQMCPPMRLTNL